MAQDQIRPGRRDDGLPDDDAGLAAVAQPAGQDLGLDAVLDEIDGVLEANAEEFVAGFVQKGGQ